MDQLETSFLKNQNLQHLVWFRYIDDIFFIWTHGEFRNFIAEFNLFSDDIKFTCEYNKDIISFLDLKVTSLNGKLITSLYSKLIDCHQYLPYGPCHTEHTKRSIVYRPLRIKRVCSQESDFNEHSLNLRSWILKRGYPEKIIYAEMSKVKFNVDNKRSNNRQKKEISFTQKFKVLQNIINTHLYLLCMNNEVKRVCTPKPMVSFRVSRKISSYIVRAKLYPIEGIPGSFRCGLEGCEVCKYITETNTFSSSITGETYKTNHRLDCNDKCLVYLLTCNKCKKQYTGQTTDNFRGRWNNYKSENKSFKEEKSAYKNIYINILKVKGILSFSMMFQ